MIEMLEQAKESSEAPGAFTIELLDLAIRTTSKPSGDKWLHPQDHVSELDAVPLLIHHPQNFPE